MKLFLTLVLAQLTPLSAWASSDTQIVWDHWYKETGPDGKSSARYEEKFELEGERYIYVVNRQASAGKVLLKSAMKSVAEAKATLSPLSFDLEQQYSGGVGQVQGRFSAPNQFVVQSQNPAGAKRSQKVRLPVKAILASFLPVWLGENMKFMKKGRTLSALILPESAASESMRITGVQIRFLEPDDFSKKTHSGKIELSWLKKTETWWVDEKGSPYRIERPSEKILIERLTPAELLEQFP